MVSRRKLKFCEKPKVYKQPGRKKDRGKEYTGPELVGSCDFCGDKLAALPTRTDQGAHYAQTVKGISVGHFINDNGNRVPHFFCCDDCLERFASTYKQQLLPVVKALGT